MTLHSNYELRPYAPSRVRLDGTLDVKSVFGQHQYSVRVYPGEIPLYIVEYALAEFVETYRPGKRYLSLNSIKPRFIRSIDTTPPGLSEDIGIEWKFQSKELTFQSNIYYVPQITKWQRAYAGDNALKSAYALYKIVESTLDIVKVSTRFQLITAEAADFGRTKYKLSSPIWKAPTNSVDGLYILLLQDLSNAPAT